MKNELKNILQGKVLILGVGNVLKQDDAFGSILAKRLGGKLKRFSVMDLEDGPENFFSKITRMAADTVLIVDCVSLGAAPGAVRLFRADEIKAANIFFTHNSSLGLFADFIRENSKAKVYLLGVQPKSIGFGEGLTEVVAPALEHLQEDILELDGKECATQYRAK